MKVIKKSRAVLASISLALMGLLMFVPMALADSPQPNLALSPDQTWTLLVGALVPAVTYVINHYAPWVSEEVKGIVLLLLSAATGAVIKLIATGGVDFTTAATWQYILFAVVAAFAAHFGFYKATNISTRLGAGSNKT